MTKKTKPANSKNDELIQREAYLIRKIKALQEENKQLNSKSWKLFWSLKKRVNFAIHPILKLSHIPPVRKLITAITVSRDLGTSGIFLLLRHKLGLLEDFVLDKGVIDFLKWQKYSEPKTMDTQVESTGVKISIIMPVWNIDPKYLQQAIHSVFEQTYKNWELCIYDDASTEKPTLELLKKYENHPYIKVKYGAENKNISLATNEALKLATGSYVLFLDDDDVLASHALNEIVKVIKKDKKTDVIYYDEDIVLSNSLRIKPILKPDWSPETLDATMYLAHAVYRRTLVNKIGGMRAGFEGSQDYDLILRVRDNTQNIVHIPKILYHWRRIPGSTADDYEAKATPKRAAVQALNDSIKRRKLNATVKDGLTAPSFRLKYKIENKPVVSIIIPTRNMKAYLSKCVKSVVEKTSYKNYEIIIINNRSDEKETLDYFDAIKSKKIRILDYDEEFNFSAINNFAVNQAKGSHVVLLNNDTKVISSDWLESMLEYSQKREIGAVGALLYFPDDTIQHAGCAIGIGGVAGHLYKYSKMGDNKMNISLDFPRIIHNVSAVTGACLMVKKSVYLEVGGLDEKFKVAFNDIDFCLKVMKAGYRNIYTPFASLYHYESKTRGYEYEDPTQEFRFNNEVSYFKAKWYNLLKKGDPYYNPNFTRENEFGELV